MQILSGLLVEKFHEIFSSVDDLFFFFRGDRSHFVKNLFIIFRSPHVGNFTSVQNIVEIF